VNDMLMRLQQFNDGKYLHTKDRAYAFEYIFHQNTDSVLHKNISEYHLPEKNGEIPMMIISPTIINDGHVLISPLSRLLIYRTKPKILILMTLSFLGFLLSKMLGI